MMRYTESPYLYGIHGSSGGDGWGSTGADLLQGKGWVVFTEAIGQDPANTDGRSYLPWAEADLGVIVRLNHGYGDDGTIPLSDYYEQFALRCSNYVSSSPGCHIWIIGNEPNLQRERPQGERIEPEEYGRCYALCREQILLSQPDAVVLLAPVGPWNVETGDWIHYLQRADSEARARGPVDGYALHTYTHGSDPALVTSEEPMETIPGRLYHFRAYRDMIDVLSQDVVYFITETNQNAPWLDANQGWVKEVYTEIHQWNHDNPTQVIRGMALYRWTHDEYEFRNRAGVQADLLQAIEEGYTWTDNPDPPIPPEEGEMQNHSLELPYHQYQDFQTVKVAEGWSPFWEGDTPEYKPVTRDVDPHRIADDLNTAQCWFLRWKHMRGGIYQTITGLTPGDEVEFSVPVQCWSSDSDDPHTADGPFHFKVGVDLDGGDDPDDPAILWTPDIRGGADYKTIETGRHTLTGPVVTLFIYAWNEWPLSHNDAYVDAIQMTIHPAPTPPTPGDEHEMRVRIDIDNTPVMDETIPLEVGVTGTTITKGREGLFHSLLSRLKG